MTEYLENLIKGLERLKEDYKGNLGIVQFIKNQQAICKKAIEDYNREKGENQDD